MAFSSRTPLIGAVLVALSVSLAGCSLLATGPARDASGQVTAASEIAATDLLVGDCFSYGPDSTVLTTVTIAPCSGEHGFIIVDKGSLTSAEVDSAGGLQVAVSAACSDKYSAFTTALSEGLHSELTFLINTKEVDDKTVNFFSCVAVDPTLDPATEAIEPAGK